MKLVDARDLLFLAFLLSILATWAWSTGEPAACDIAQELGNPRPVKCLEFWFNRYQTLFAGLLAVAAAAVAGVPVWLQLRATERHLALERIPLAESAFQRVADKKQLLFSLEESLESINPKRFLVEGLIVVGEGLTSMFRQGPSTVEEARRRLEICSNHIEAFEQFLLRDSSFRDHIPHERKLISSFRELIRVWDQSIKDVENPDLFTFSIPYTDPRRATRVAQFSNVKSHLEMVQLNTDSEYGRARRKIDVLTYELE